VPAWPAAPQSQLDACFAIALAELTDPPAAAAPRPRPSRRRRIGLVVAGVVALVALWAVVDLLRVQRDIRAGEHVLRSAKAADLARPNGLRRVADRGLGHFDHANRIARRAVPFVLARPVPILGRQVAALRSMTATARRVAVIGDDAARAIQVRLDGAAHGPDARIALLDTLVTEVARARGRLAGVHVPRTPGLLAPLTSQRSRMEASLRHARSKMDEAGVMVGALRRMFVGPSRFLVLGGNNAEMRAGGMALSVGVVTLDKGHITVGRFKPTGQLFVGRYGPKPPEELQKLFYDFSIGHDWRGTGVTPNFPVKGPLYAEMAPHRPKLGPVDGVIYVDMFALRAVMAATGPVEVQGVKYTIDNVMQQVLNENYIKFPTDDNDSPRYTLQSRLAGQIFNALNTRNVKFGPLVANLSGTGQGRHIMAWAKDPGLQKIWERAGIDGRLDRNGLMVNLENISANKLDWYITPKVSMRTLSVKKNLRTVELKVSFTNAKRTRTSDAIEGIKYDRANGMADGEHRVFLVLYLPKSAFNVASKDPPFVAAGEDGPMKVVGMRYGVKVGESRTVRITFVVPKSQTFRIIPSGRAHPVPFVTPKGTFRDNRPRLIKL
jgi:hypothetical protein